MKKLILAIGLLAVLAMPLAACNTIEGMGKDTKAAGNAIEDSAKDSKGY